VVVEIISGEDNIHQMPAKKKPETEEDKKRAAAIEKEKLSVRRWNIAAGVAKSVVGAAVAVGTGYLAYQRLNHEMSELEYKKRVFDAKSQVNPGVMSTIFGRRPVLVPTVAPKLPDAPPPVNGFTLGDSSSSSSSAVSGLRSAAQIAYRRYVGMRNAQNNRQVPAAAWTAPPVPMQDVSHEPQGFRTTPVEGGLTFNAVPQGFRTTPVEGGLTFNAGSQTTPVGVQAPAGFWYNVTAPFVMNTNFRNVFDQSEAEKRNFSEISLTKKEYMRAKFPTRIAKPVPPERTVKKSRR
jgi:hypothetical protein